MTTYKQIQEYVKQKHGVSIKTCWIADMKEICGLPKRVAINRTVMIGKFNYIMEIKKK